MTDDRRRRTTRTARHLTRGSSSLQGDVTEYNAPVSPPGRDFIPRLSWLLTRDKVEYDIVRLVHGLARHPDDPFIFVDASLFDDRTHPAVWSALLSRPRGMTIVPSIRGEIEPWLRSHLTHPAAQAILLGDAAVELQNREAGTEEEAIAFEYYVNLIGLRRRMLTAELSKFRDHKGRDPTSEELVTLRGRVQAEVGERGYVLAKKGAVAEGRPNRCADERLVYGATSAGIRTGRPTYILTKDEDIQEQFYKLIWLMDTQYRGMLLARAFRAHPSRFVSRPMPMVDFYAEAFNGEGNVVLQRPSDDLEELLPDRFRFVDLHCLVLGEQLMMMTFGAEMEMSELLKVKGRTRGLNTEELGGQNCHIYLPDVKATRDISPTAAIGWDNSRPVPGTRVRLSLTDANLAMLPVEGSSTLLRRQVVTATLLDMPPTTRGRPA